MSTRERVHTSAARKPAYWNRWRESARILVSNRPIFRPSWVSTSKPTIVNNVETICHVKHILRMGAAEYAKIGTPGDGGTRTMCVSGDVMQELGFYELPAGAVTTRRTDLDVRVACA